METNQFIKATVGVVVVFLVIIVVAIPIIGGFTESSPGEMAENASTIETTDDTFLAALSPGATVSVTETEQMTINGNELPISFGSSTNLGYSYIVTKDIVICVNGANSTMVTYNNDVVLNPFPVNLNWSGTELSASFINTNASNEPVSFTVPCTEMFIYGIAGADFDMNSMLNQIGAGPEYAKLEESGGTPVYVNQDTMVIVPSNNRLLFGIGTYDNVEYNILPSGSSPSISFSLGEPDGSAIQLTGYENSGNLPAYKVAYVPMVYYISEPTEAQVSGPVADMINLVPLLLIVGLIIAAVAAFITLKSREGGA